MRFRCCAIAGFAMLLPMLASAQSGDGTRTFTVDAETSDVHWRVYKAGAFARFGHNHVISVAGLSGTVVVSADGAADWSLAFDVDDLVVDDPSLREIYGEDFESEPSEDDIAGTKTNMLSETVLNGAQFSTIRISGGAYDGTLDSAQLSATIRMLGREIELQLPGSVAIDGDDLVAEGEFSLEHEDLGMTPFSVMMGALQVGPRIDFTYRIHAVAGD